MLHKKDAGQAPQLPRTLAGNTDNLRVENAAAGRLGDPNPILHGASDSRMIVLRGTLLALFRRDGRDLTARQLTAFLSVYMDETTYTVSSLADLLHISRPCVIRIMDRLVEFDLMAREEDRGDRRRVLVRHTSSGIALFRELVATTRNISTEHEAISA